MDTYFLTDTGKVRDHNEDSVMIIPNKNKEYLIAVADGMGGHNAGEIASSIAIDYLAHNFGVLDSIGDKEQAIEWIRESVIVINDKIYQYTLDNPHSKGMGTTLVLALYTENYLLFGNVGDSVGFVVKNNKLYKVTKDHTLVNLLVQTGELTEEEARYHPRKNVLMRALGANEIAKIDIFDVDHDIDGILICSDGLTNMLTVDQIESVLSERGTSIKDKIEKLMLKSNNRGGTDNISIALMMKESGGVSDI